MILSLYLDPLCARWVHYHLTETPKGKLEFRKQCKLREYIDTMLEPSLKMEFRAKESKGKERLDVYIKRNSHKKTADSRYENLYVSEENQKRLNIFITNLIEVEMVSFVTGWKSKAIDVGHKKQQVNIKKAIYVFLENYKIPKPEKHYEAVKKMIQRLEQKKNLGDRRVKTLIIK